MHRLTYLNTHLKKGCLIRWPNECFPLPVYIAPCSWYSMNESDKLSYMNMVIDAFNTWERVGEGRFSFYLVNNLNDSQLNVEWRRVDRKSLGNCSFNYDSQSRLYSAEVSIGISDGILHKQYMDENEVYHTILHEIGHALGLGHSNHPGDIMYTPHQYGITNLSQRDIDSVRWLYSLPYGASVNSLNATYSTNFGNIDDIILHIAAGDIESEFQRTMNNIQQTPKRNLEEDQQKLAQMGRFNIAIQNIRLPKELSDKFKDM